MNAMLLCEGGCGSSVIAPKARTRALDLDAREEQMALAHALRYQPHTFVREVITDRPQSSRQFWSCDRCDHERVWG